MNPLDNIRVVAVKKKKNERKFKGNIYEKEDSLMVGNSMWTLEEAETALGKQITVELAKSQRILLIPVEESGEKNGEFTLNLNESTRG